MSTAYVGFKGSGKTYGVFENAIIPALKNQRDVWTNIPFNEEVVFERLGFSPTYFSIDDIKANDDWFQDVLPKGVLLIIDEAWKLWPSGIKASNAIEGHKSFLAEHRHMVGENGRSTELIIVTQDLSQIASFVRVLIEFTYRSEKLSRIGQANKYRIDIYHGPVTGAKPSKSRRDREIFGTYKKEVYELYKSHTQSETGQAGDETRVDGRSNMLKGAWLKFNFLFIVLGVFFVLYGFRSVSSNYGGNPQSFDEVSEFSVEPLSKSAIAETEVLIEPEDPPFFDVFDGFDVSIVFNNGRYPSIDYVLRFVDSQSAFHLTGDELTDLGYTLTPVNQCLLFVDFNRRRYPIMCQSADSNDLVDFDWTVSEDS